MSPRGQAITRTLAAVFKALEEHGKTHPGEVDGIVAQTVAHLRSWRPESVSPLGTLPRPEQPIRDPRTNG